jgi:phage/plasmid-like protein (TIGR03299 family)
MTATNPTTPQTQDGFWILSQQERQQGRKSHRRPPWGANVIRRLTGDKYAESGIRHEMGPDRTKGEVRIAEASTVPEAFNAAGLNFDVVKVPLVAPTEFDYDERMDGGIIVHGQPRLREVPDRFLTVRTDTGDPLGVVGSRYEVLQNSRTAAFVETLVDTAQSEQVAAGMTGNGERVFAVVKLNDQMVVGNLPSEATEVYLMATSTHDGSGSWKASVFPMRMVCSNTLRITLKDYVSSWTIRHTQSANWSIKEAQRALGLVGHYLEGWEEFMSSLYEKEMAPDRFDAFLNSLIEDPEKPSKEDDEKAIARFEKQLRKAREMRGQIAELYETAEEFNAIRGTEYGALQAANTWELWERPIKGVRDEMRAEWQLGKLFSERDENRITKKAAKMLVGGGVER